MLIAFTNYSQSDTLKKPSEFQATIVSELQKTNRWKLEEITSFYSRSFKAYHKSKPIIISWNTIGLSVYNNEMEVFINLTETEENSIEHAFNLFIGEFKKREQEKARKALSKN